MKFDAIVIGSGQGGNPMAFALANEGWKVALIERNRLGGTCINTGCTPTKAMIASAQVAFYAANAFRWGVKTKGVGTDLGAVIDRKNKIVEDFRTGWERRFGQQANLTLFRGHAKFAGPHQIAAGEEVFESQNIFIDTGTRPALPDIAGLDAVPYLTNATLMELRDLPKHLVVIGGGYIGLEFGQMFARFGSRVTIIHRGNQLLVREDPDIVKELQDALESEGIKILLNARTREVEKKGSEIALTIETKLGSTAIAGSHLLIATGRKPNTDDLDLARAGILADERGYIKVNSRLETNVSGVWALGDVKGGPAFTHISYNDYQILFGNIIKGKDLTIEKRYVPYAVFTDPQLGRVGMTEGEARASGRKLKIGTYPMSKVARAIERDETRGLMKLIADGKSDQIIGAAILGSEGGELVQIIGAMILAGAPYTVLKDAVYIHPTLAEGFFGLMDSMKPVS